MDLNLDLTTWQGKFIKSNSLIKMLSGASDTGKSWVCRLHQILTSLNNPKSHHFAATPVYTQTERAVIEPMMDFIQSISVSLADYRKGDQYIRFQNGSRIEMMSSDNMWSRLRSREFSTGFFEEATTFPEKHIEKVFYESIRRLRQRGMPNHLLLATNPDLETCWIYRTLFDPIGRQETQQRIYDMMIKAGFTIEQAKERSTFYCKELAFKDGYNRNDKERESKILMGSQREIDLFYHGKWGRMEGRAFNLEKDRHIREVKNDECEKYYITFDYGFFPDPMVYLLTSERNGTIFVVDEIILYEIPVNRHEAYLQKWYENYNIVGFTGETATGAGEIRDLLYKQKFAYYATSKKRSEGWVKLADLIDLDRLVIDPRCKNLIRGLGNQIWVGSTKGVDCEGELDDPADALRYFIMCTLIKHRLKTR